jgi:chemotaxis protein methyltransferase CheR
MISKEERAFKFLLKKINDETGMDFSQYRPRGLKRRISTQLRATHSADYTDYIALLDRDPAEYERLISAITVKVTEFFRDPRVFKLIEKKVIPDLVSSKEEKGEEMIQVWNAGVSFGEESYSMAILLYEVLKERISEFAVRIIATDVDNQCIEKAKLGMYEPGNLKKLTPRILRKYFTFSDGRYIVKDNLRLLISYKRHNIISNVPLRCVDLIMCRQ